MLNEIRDSKGRTIQEAHDEFVAASCDVTTTKDGCTITTYQDGWKSARWEYRGVTCKATRCPRARDWLGEAHIPEALGGTQRLGRDRSLAATKKAAAWIIDRKLPTETRNGQLAFFK